MLLLTIEPGDGVTMARARRTTVQSSPLRHYCQQNSRSCRNIRVDALISDAENVGANLIAVGNSGMSGVTRFVLGSVPDKVAVTRPAAC